MTAANALVPEASRRDRDWVLQLTSEMEGHPDNVAPAIFGGLALSWQDSDQYSSTCATVAATVIPVVAVPDFELSTEAARALLPASVGHHAAAMNSGRAALLIHALTQKPEFLLPGTEDYLHQSYRAQAMRPSADLIAALRRRRLRRRRVRGRSHRAGPGQRGTEAPRRRSSSAPSPRATRRTWAGV